MNRIAWLPWPPTVNTYWRHTVIDGQVRTLISKQGRDYRKTAAGALARQGLCYADIPDRLALRLVAHPPDRRKRDLDNLPKGLLDAMTQADVWQDDSQIDDLRIVRGAIVKGGIVIVHITLFQPEELQWLREIPDDLQAMMGAR